MVTAAKIAFSSCQKTKRLIVGVKRVCKRAGGTGRGGSRAGDGGGNESSEECELGDEGWLCKRPNRHGRCVHYDANNEEANRNSEW